MTQLPRPRPAVTDPGRIRLADQPALEPALNLGDVCKLRRVSRRTGERERSARLWPSPDFFVGTGTGSRKSPRWMAATIARWLAEGSQP
jgi:hypothetical protein